MNKPKPPVLPDPTVEKRTLVDEGTRFKGSLTSSCPIVVHGSVEGDVEGPTVTVSATGEVSGRISATSLKSEGKISGHFDVENAEVAGSVAKNTVLRGATLDLKLTATTGKLQLSFGTADDKGNPRPVQH